MEIDKDNALTLIASVGIVSVLAALWFCLDMVAKPVKPVGSWARFRWLRLVRREEYVGRHRPVTA